MKKNKSEKEESSYTDFAFFYIFQVFNYMTSVSFVNRDGNLGYAVEIFGLDQTPRR